jgi:hypothetical protein
MAALAVMTTYLKLWHTLVKLSKYRSQRMPTANKWRAAWTADDHGTFVKQYEQAKKYARTDVVYGAKYLMHWTDRLIDAIDCRVRGQVSALMRTLHAKVIRRLNRATAAMKVFAAEYGDNMYIDLH